MAFIRRHLAAFGLAVALIQSTLQAVLPIGVCCATMAQRGEASPKPAMQCHTAQTDADGICPMHRGSRSQQVASHDEPDYRLVCTSRSHQALHSLTLGVPLPSVVTTIADRASVAAPAPAEPRFLSLAPDLLTPPPRS